MGRRERGEEIWARGRGGAGWGGLGRVGGMEVLTEEEEAGEKAGERKWNLMNRGRQGASMRK